MPDPGLPPGCTQREIDERYEGRPDAAAMDDAAMENAYLAGVIVSIARSVYDGALLEMESDMERDRR